MLMPMRHQPHHRLAQVSRNIFGLSAEPGHIIDLDAAPLLQLDAQRAYLAGPADGTVHEIDFADGARVARTIELPVAPVAFAEAGL